MIFFRLNYILLQFYDEITKSYKQQMAKQIIKSILGGDKTILSIQSHAVFQTLSL